MEKFKIAMGFPLLATAVWLMWVASSREDDELWIGLFLVVLALAAWIWGQFVQRGTRHRLLAALICLLFVGADYGFVLEGQLQWRSPAQSKKTGIDWKVWSAEAVEEARPRGHPVLVDFTAKSCLTCKLNLASSSKSTAPGPNSNKSTRWHSRPITPTKIQPLARNCAGSTPGCPTGAGIFKRPQSNTASPADFPDPEHRSRRAGQSGGIAGRLSTAITLIRRHAGASLRNSRQSFIAWRASFFVTELPG